MSNNETFAEISKELRRISQGTRFCELHLPTVNGKPLGPYLAEIADRIDAAAELYTDKRVVAYEPVSNKAAWIALARIGNAIQLKMKECPLAVTTHEYAIMNLCYRTFADHPNHGTPPRNCDIYPERDEAGEAWNMTLDERTRDMVQRDPLTAMDMFIDWLLAYAEPNARGDLCHEG